MLRKLTVAAAVFVALAGTALAAPADYKVEARGKPKGTGSDLIVKVTNTKTGQPVTDAKVYFFETFQGAKGGTQTVSKVLPSDGKGNFSESLPWSRPHLTISEAQYGPSARGINVTQKLMRLAAQGGLPIEINPAMFNLDPHAPEAWELTIAWRTADGEMRRTLRDDSILTWP